MRTLGRRSSQLIAIGLLALAGCGSQAPAPADTDAMSVPADTANPPVVFADCIKPSVEPKSITIACADAGFVLDDLAWSSWGEDEAAAEGTAVVNNCEPSCGEGDFGRFASEVTLSKISDCDVKPTYMAISIDFRDEAPKGYDDPYETTLTCGEH